MWVKQNAQHINNYKTRLNTQGSTKKEKTDSQQIIFGQPCCHATTSHHLSF